MNATIHRLHPVHPIGHFLRLGHTGYRKLENLHASGRLSIKRVVVDAAHASEQIELLDTLRDSNTEIVLDTKVAELSTPGGFLTSARKLPWADADRPYSVDNFSTIKINDLVARIADFAVKYRVNAVLSPSRLLKDGIQDSWLSIDAKACHALREALDERGAKSIAIDYPLLTMYRTILDGASRKAFVAHLNDMPFEYLWLRIGNFGSDKSAAGMRKYINALRDFHELEKPVISDGVGGLPALGVVAFGAAGAICHGVAEKERFYPNDWWRPQKSGGGGGARSRIYFPGLDTYFDEAQTRALLATRSAKPLLACRDTGCCPSGWEDMILNQKSHYLNQSTRRVEELGRVPDARRVEHFLSHQLAPVDRIARNAVRLRVDDEKLHEKLLASSRKADDMRRVLEELHATNHNLSRSRAPIKRAGRSSEVATNLKK